MFLNGTIKLKGPEFEKKEVNIVNEDSGDLSLEMDKAGTPTVDDFDIWIEIARDKEIKILARDLDDKELLYNYILVELKGKIGRVALDLSPKQAATLSEVLQHYVTAFYEAKALRTERIVKVEGAT